MHKIRDISNLPAVHLHLSLPHQNLMRVPSYRSLLFSVGVFPFKRSWCAVTHRSLQSAKHNRTNLLRQLTHWLIQSEKASDPQSGILQTNNLRRVTGQKRNEKAETSWLCLEIFYTVLFEVVLDLRAMTRTLLYHSLTKPFCSQQKPRRVTVTSVFLRIISVTLIIASVRL